MPRVTIPSAYVDEPVGFVLKEHAPAQGAAGLAFSQAVYQNTKLPFRIVEGARYRTAQINGCVTCQSWRAERDLPPSLARKGGDAAQSFVGRGDPAPDEAFYDAVADWRTAALFSERERLAIEFAERMGLEPRSFEGDEVFWARMHAAFAEAEIVDLTLAIASWIAMGRTLHILEIDPQVCAMPPRAVAA